jgi:hypothetical protein
VENREFLIYTSGLWEFLIYEWTVTDHPLFWISSHSLGVTCYLYWDGQEYGWVEHSSQVVGFTIELKDKCFIYFLSYFMCLIVVFLLCV